MPQSQGDVDKRNGAEIATRAVIAFLIHLLFGAVAAAVLYFLTRDFDQASEALRQSVGTADDAEASIFAFLAEARASLMGWVAFSILGSWIAATLFIAIGQRHEPRTDEEASKCFAIWGILMIVTLLVSTLIWWRRVSLGQVAMALTTPNYIAIIAVTVGMMLLAYFFSTAMAVKHTVKRSIPGAALLPSIRK